MEGLQADEGHLIEKYSSVEYLNTHALELMRVCHKLTPLDESQSVFLSLLPLELLLEILGYISVDEIQAIAASATQINDDVTTALDFIITTAITMWDDGTITTTPILGDDISN